MALQLATIGWNEVDERDPQNADIGGWEDLVEPIDQDIDEDEYVANEGANLIDK